jgi:uncharacterized membrane protein
MRAIRLCCSKKALWTSWGVFIVLLCSLLYGFFFTTKDLMPLVTVICFDGGVTAAATAFYYWKARAENRIKLTKAMVEAWADKYGIEAVANLANIVLKE